MKLPPSIVNAITAFAVPVALIGSMGLACGSLAAKSNLFDTLVSCVVVTTVIGAAVWTFYMTMRTLVLAAFSWSRRIIRAVQKIPSRIKATDTPCHATEANQYANNPTSCETAEFALDTQLVG